MSVHLSDQELVRREALQKLRALGIEPFPAAEFPVTSNPQFQNPFVLNARVNLSNIRSRHTLKGGYEYQMINTEVDDVNPKYGADTYSGQFSRPRGRRRMRRPSTSPTS